MSAFEVGAYFYPLTQQCPEKQARARSLGRSVADEIALARDARPLFEGHAQPTVYCLDEQTRHWDDSDESAMDAHITLAQDAGLGFFIFDSYEGMSRGRQVIEAGGPLDIFRRATDRNLKYAKMETFASPRTVLPVPRDPSFFEPGRVYDLSRDSVRFIIDQCAQNDWDNPHYLYIRDRPYLSLFVPDLTPGWNEGWPLGAIVEEMHIYANKKYGIEPYIVGSARTVSQAEELDLVGVNAMTGYAFLPEFGDGVMPLQDYQQLVEIRKAEWDKIASFTTFIPPAVVGWDASPRGKSFYQLGVTCGHSYAPIVLNSSPEAYACMLKDTLEFAMQAPPNERYGIICAWNEITEGAALLPRITKDGIDKTYLDCTQKVIEEVLHVS